MTTDFAQLARFALLAEKLSHTGVLAKAVEQAQGALDAYLDANPDVTTVVHPYIISGVDGAAMTVKLHFSDTSGDDEDTDRYSITTGSAQVRIIYV